MCRNVELLVQEGVEKSMEVDAGLDDCCSLIQEDVL